MGALLGGAIYICYSRHTECTHFNSEYSRMPAVALHSIVVESKLHDWKLCEIPFIAFCQVTLYAHKERLFWCLLPLIKPGLEFVFGVMLAIINQKEIVGTGHT